MTDELYAPNVALIVVDYQNDFCTPEGSLYVAGADALLEPINQEIERARRASAKVVYTQDWHPEKTPHFQEMGGAWPPHCIAGSWGADLVPRLIKAGQTIHKGTGTGDGYSGFFDYDIETSTKKSTGLTELLRSENINTVIIVGVATDYCVKHTAIDAVQEGFRVTVLTNCIRPVNIHPNNGELAIIEMKSYGVIFQ